MMNREASFTKQRSSNPNLQLINVEASNGNQNGGTHSEALARSLNANARVRGKEGKKIQQRAIRGDRQMAEVLGLTKQKKGTRNFPKENMARVRELECQRKRLRDMTASSTMPDDKARFRPTRYRNVDSKVKQQMRASRRGGFESKPGARSESAAPPSSQHTYLRAHSKTLPRASRSQSARRGSPPLSFDAESADVDLPTTVGSDFVRLNTRLAKFGRLPQQSKSGHHEATRDATMHKPGEIPKFLMRRRIDEARKIKHDWQIIGEKESLGTAPRRGVAGESALMATGRQTRLLQRASSETDSEAASYTKKTGRVSS